MTHPSTSEAPIEAAADVAGERATEAFSLLGNETRLAILLALWEVYEPHSDDSAISFSDLRDRVGVRDSGQFNYHLGKLEERFIRKAEDGYELRRTGLKLIQSIIAGTGIEEPTLEPTEIDATCEVCGASTEVTYGNGFVYQVCPDCAEESTRDDDHPPGIRVAWTFEPTGLSDRSAEDVFTASTIKNFGRIVMRFEGICPDCSGPVEWSHDICESHDPTSGGECPNCGRTEAIQARETCTVCKSSGHGSPSIKVLFHPAVISFYYNHGIELGFTGQTGFADVIQALELVDGFEEEVVSTNPLRYQITVSCEGDELRLLLDEEFIVIDVDMGD